MVYGLRVVPLSGTGSLTDHPGEARVGLPTTKGDRMPLDQYELEALCERVADNLYEDDPQEAIKQIAAQYDLDVNVEAQHA